MNETEWVECPHCHGKKKEFPDCEDCNGYGWVEDPGGGTMTCPACNDETCSECNGEGEVQSNNARSGLAETSAEIDYKQMDDISQMWSDEESANR